MKKFYCILLAALLLAGILTVPGFAGKNGGYLPGDGDMNGAVTVDDARMALRVAVRLEKEPDLPVLDVDGKPGVTVDDARFILRIAVKLESAPAYVKAESEPASAEESTTSGTAWGKIKRPGIPSKSETTTAENETEEEPSLGGDPSWNRLLSADVNEFAVSYTYEIHSGLDNGEALGSGFSISEDGKIVTNYHVVSGSKKLTVKNKDGEEFEVTDVLAYDAYYDIAVLKINAKTVAAPLNRNNYRTGDTVYSLGSPISLSYTFNPGMISNRQRSLADLGYREKMYFIQMNTPISPGNSGGPLIDECANVIGINTLSVTSDDNTVQNINFAVPVSYIDELDFSAPLTADEFYNSLPQITAERITGYFRNNCKKDSSGNCTISRVYKAETDREGVTVDINEIISYNLGTETMTFTASYTDGVKYTNTLSWDIKNNKWTDKAEIDKRILPFSASYKVNPQYFGYNENFYSAFSSVSRKGIASSGELSNTLIMSLFSVDYLFEYLQDAGLRLYPQYLGFVNYE